MQEGSAGCGPSLGPAGQAWALLGPGVLSPQSRWPHSSQPGALTGHPSLSQPCPPHMSPEQGSSEGCRAGGQGQSDLAGWPGHIGKTESGGRGEGDCLELHPGRLSQALTHPRGSPSPATAT